MPFILSGKNRSIPFMSPRRKRRLFILSILGAGMCRNRGSCGTAGFALQALAHRLAPSDHVCAGLHLRN